MRRLTRNPSKKRQAPRLVRMALRRWETNACWEAIAELQARGSPQTLASAQKLARSPNWRRRALGAYIASQLRQGRASPAEYALEETHRLLLAALEDPHVEVVRAAVSGLGHRPNPAAVPELVRLASHRHHGLRWNVAVALGRYPQPLAVEALLRLMSDPDDDVRDWATFGMGSLQEVDTPEIRAALQRNLSDRDADVRGEALVGLARRRDGRVVEHLLEQLGPECRVYELDAAESMADPRLLGSLEALQALVRTFPSDDKDGYWSHRLAAAIDACRDGSLNGSSAR